jgi:hypothetical protein
MVHLARQIRPGWRTSRTSRFPTRSSNDNRPDLELPLNQRDANSTWERFAALVRSLPA